MKGRSYSTLRPMEPTRFDQILGRFVRRIDERKRATFGYFWSLWSKSNSCPKGAKRFA